MLVFVFFILDFGFESLSFFGLSGRDSEVLELRKSLILKKYWR